LGKKSKNYLKNRYYSHYSIFSPSCIVMKIAGKNIEKEASRFLNGKLLDIGCGEKWKKDLIGQYVDEYIGLDHKDSLHDKSNVDIYGSVYDIPVGNNEFDSVLCTAVLEHTEEPDRAIAECFRVLKKNGHALYTIPLFWHLHEEPRDFFRYTKYGLKYIFEKNGFEIIKMIPMSGFWITFGAEFNYYLNSISSRFIPNLIKPFIAFNNFLFSLLDKIDRKFNKSTEIFTWMYLVIVKK